MKQYIEPRTEVSDAALAAGDRNAWKQALGFHTNELATALPPREPNQIPPGDLEDAVGDHEETEFNEDDGDDEEDNGDDDE